MTVFERPLADRIVRPLGAGLLWCYVTASAAAVVVVLVGGGAWLVPLVGSWVGDGSAAAPWELARTTAAVLAPFTVASSTWAVTFGSSDRHTLVRALAGTAAGAVLLVAAVRGAAPQLTIAAFAVAWSLAIPFDRIGRPAARLLAAAALVAAGGAVWPQGAAGWWLCAVSPTAAAAAAAGGDRVWRWIAPGTRPHRRAGRQ